MTIQRSYERTFDAARPISIELNYYDYTEGSCIVKYGNTEVLCVATVEDSAAPHLRGTGKGWITSEYNMLPRAGQQRIRRDRSLNSGRTHEIKRLIGRSLRAVANMKGWGEKTMILDCDVLRADGGTRTASITGSFIAMVLAFRHLKKSGRIQGDIPFPVQQYLSAISVGLSGNQAVLDLDYKEDSTAAADMNVVMTSTGHLVEVQATGEERPFSKDSFSQLMELANKGCEQICDIQRELLGPLDW